jgi:Ca-activated chloride channel family protein
MSFARPSLLFLLLLPAFLLFWEATRRGRIIPLPFDHGEERRGRAIELALIFSNWLAPFLLAAAVFILAGPRKPGKPDEERELTNIQFCLDVSGSMTSPFGGATQYDAAMESIQGFTSRRKGDAFGLTIFGNEVLRWVPLTRDLSAIRSATPFLRPEKLPGHFGGTEIGKALRFCREALLEPGEGDRLIILLSDGQSADLPGSTPREIGDELAQAGIVLYAIHIGEGAVPEELHHLSRPTGGQVFSVRHPQALQGVFEHIDRMRPVLLRPRAIQEVDAFGPFAWAGAALTGLAALSLLGLRYTPW